MTEKIARFLAENAPDTPCLVVDIDVICEAYDLLCRYLPIARVYYAVKANPAPQIVRALGDKGSNFDVASRAEIELCLDNGATADRLSFGNTIKKERDIAFAYQAGVRLFAFDSERELEKLARAAPGAQVFCRILVACDGAEWPLSRKFGCSPEMAAELLCKARALGLDPYGVSFHVGSQQTDLSQWDGAIGSAARMFTALAEADINLRMVNIGGGFPARYRAAVSPVAEYARAVNAALTRHFGNDLPAVIVEPGRSLVGDAGIIQSEVVLIADKGDGGGKRWVYLDVGKFNGLAETMGESIKYRIATPGRGGPAGPVVIAGPTCDSADILYEHAEYSLPLDLEVGDKVEILAAGAYTASYASVGFNGFPPLRTYCV
ncbi:MAG: type III PLP-dependent enzyme [Alphaproteobacteria bacterium]|nr:type III PLP-dependent enzyme [Alphaproteobacteria bacterium]MBV9862463.1 type III PLP-dependent enzyme [Alphaproteobacteria bacterium]